MIVNRYTGLLVWHTPVCNVCTPTQRALHARSSARAAAAAAARVTVAIQHIFNTRIGTLYSYHDAHAHRARLSSETFVILGSAHRRSPQPNKHCTHHSGTRATKTLDSHGGRRGRGK